VNNTGNESDDQLWGETVCATDGTISQAAANTATPEVQLLVAGSPELAMPDNIAYQPGRGNWIIHEDADTGYLRPHNNDLWDCLPDGADADLLSDGCVRIATLNDLTAEWTGGIFDASGKHFYVSVQHNISGKGVVLDITGWK
jgi:secreted PhoX family phosphatase